MATIAENLVALNEAKANIKAAIEGKGQDLTDVPFTQYADKINEISAGGDDDTLKGLIDGTITSVRIPEGTTKLRDYAFYKQSTLVDVKIPNSITSIGANAFQDCKALSIDLVIPENMTAIPNYCFQNCSNLKSLTFNNNLKTIGNYAFQNASKIPKLEFPSTLTTIGSYVFQGLSLITELVLPTSCRLFDWSCFMNCTALTKVEINGTPSQIPNAMFANDSNLLKVVFSGALTSVPSLLNTNAFQGIHENCKIYVPDDLYDAWIVKTNWVTYASKIAKLSEMPVE